MARKTKSGKELAFHKGTKRWYKTHKGKEYYFGHGTSERDSRSYEAAMKKYLPWKQEQESADKLKRVGDVYLAVLDGKLPVADLGTSPWALNLVTGFKQLGYITEDGYYNRNRWEEGETVSESGWITVGMPESEREQIEQQQRDAYAVRVVKKAQAPKRARTKTIQQHIDAWLAEEKTRVGIGTESGLSPNAYKSKDDGLKTMREFVGSKTFGKPEAVDALCLDYRQYLLKCMADPTSAVNSANTVNDKTKFAGQFIEWCWKRSIIKDPPRTLSDMRKKLHVEKGGKPLSVEDVQKLWAVAGPKMKCYMALGLNCGFKNGDITSLTGSMIQEDRLVGIREKTKKTRVPMNYKLWPLTQHLIKSLRDKTGKDELLFVNQKGERINTGTFSSLFKKIAKKAGVTATFEQLRDTSAEQVKQAIFQGGGDLSLLQVFLAHADKSTASYYTGKDPEHLKSPRLDQIVLDLQETYGLKLDASTLKAPTK